MLGRKTILLACLAATAGFASVPKKEDWCFRDKKIGDTIYIKGIVDYKDMNFCKVIITLPSSTLEFYYTRDGELIRVVEKKKSKKSVEVDFKDKNVYLRVFDKKGNIFEEFKSKETF